MTNNGSTSLQDKRRASLARIEKLAWWLDDAFEIPVIGKRVGIDGIVGIVPFVGDFIGVGLSSMMIAEALRLGAPKRVWLRMGANVGVDFVVGLVPVAGDIFDIVFKANRRNQKVMTRWLHDVTGVEEKSSRWSGTTTVVVSLVAALLVSVGLWHAVF